jgi:serine-type anaerobic sulfatase-maturating enzyme
MESNSMFSFSLMAKPMGAICNLNCKYCFYTPKKELYPNMPLGMSDEVLENYTRQYIEAMKIPEITFAWQGGEPTLMGVEFFKKAIKYQEKYKKPGTRIYNTIQTNGILLDDEWCEFFRENNFLVGISIDGPQEHHDVYRKDKKGNPTFNRVMYGIRLMKKHRVKFNILATVNRMNADHPLEVYRFFRDDVGTQYIQFIPIVEVVSKDSDDIFQVSDESVLPEQYGKFLTTIFDEWIKNDVGKVFVQIFDATLASWVGYPQSVCIFAPTCGTAMIIEHNGDVYACDHFVDPEHLLGNIMDTKLEELVASSKQFQFGQDKKNKISPQCLKCNFKNTCWGACPKHRFINVYSGDENLNYLCLGYKEFFDHVKWPMRIMASLFNQGKVPGEVMQILEGDYKNLIELFPDVKRNEPCPCGSGLKFKKCHGKSK